MTDQTLPASWFVNERFFELENRAIFSKSWLFAMHHSRFKKTGDYFKLELAGFPIILIKGKDGEIQAFHNVCRHRAYPVVKKDSGSSAVLSCRYHGWSYDTAGNLIKAPGFENVANFDKSANGLYKIKTYTTRQGLIFINFDATPDAVPFEEFYKGLEDECDDFDFANFEYVESWELDGEFNWKTLMDGYHECYHCPTAHPSFSKAIKVPTYNVIPKTNYARHSADVHEAETLEPETEPEAEKSSWFSWAKAPEKKPSPVQGDCPGLWLSLFPLNGMNCYSYAWYLMRIVPKSAGRTVLEYDIFGKKGEDPKKIQDFVRFLKEVELEDFNLCTLTQKNLKVGVYSTGQLHPEKENGVLYYQNLAKEAVLSHLELEKTAGREIYPAFAGLSTMDQQGTDAEKVCQQLDCKTSNSILAW